MSLCDNFFSLLSFGRAFIEVRHKQDWDQGFILLLLQTAVLPASDAGSDGVKPASSFVMKPSNLVLNVVSNVWTTLLERNLRLVHRRHTCNSV